MDASRGAQDAGSRRARTRCILLAAIALLFAASVPWYRSVDAPLRLWLGLPDWVATALLCYVAAAVLNAWAWWIADVRDPGEPGGRDDEPLDADARETP